MLTGSLPFRGDSVVEVAIQHVSQEVPAPSSIVVEVPAWLDGVVAKATAKDPAERFANASEMASALRAGVRTTPATAVMTAPPTRETPRTEPLPPPSAPPPTRRPLRKRSVALIAAMVSLAVLAVGAATLAFFADDLFGSDENSAATGPQRLRQGGRRGAGEVTGIGARPSRPALLRPSPRQLLHPSRPALPPPRHRAGRSP